MSPLDECRLIELPKIGDPRGLLTFIEGKNHIPFEIKRVYYLYEVPEIASRGGHAHKALEQLIIAINGSFDINLNDGNKSKSFKLSAGNIGLYIPPMIWRDIDHFIPGTVCLVLASQPYDEFDYYRNIDEFSKAAKKLIS